MLFIWVLYSGVVVLTGHVLVLLRVPGNRKSRDMVCDYVQSPAGQE